MQKIVPKDSPTPSAIRLWKLRQLTGLIRSDFAKHFRLDIEKVKNWEESNTDITEEEAYTLSSLLKKEGIFCSTEWILEGLGSGPQIKMTF